MGGVQVTAFDLAQRFVGEVYELPGKAEHPFIQWCHSLCVLGYEQPDEVPWCSSFMNALAFMLQLPRSKSAAARSWLHVGTLIDLGEAEPGNDVVVFSRGDNPAQGHVGLYAGHDASAVSVLGGNQGNAVSVQRFPRTRLLQVRRLA